MTLLEKIDIVLKKYNNGEDNEYSLSFKKAIEKSKIDTYDIYVINTEEDYLVITTSYGKIIWTWSIKELIGICILDNNPELFKQD